MAKKTYKNESGDDINIEEFLLDVMNSNTPFGKDLKLRVTSIVDKLSAQVQSELSNIKISPKEISIPNIMGVDEKTQEEISGDL